MLAVPLMKSAKGVVTAMNLISTRREYGFADLLAWTRLIGWGATPETLPPSKSPTYVARAEVAASLLTSEVVKHETPSTDT
jgi:hypothetical protein